MRLRRRTLASTAVAVALLFGGAVADAGTTPTAKTKLSVDTIVSNGDQRLFAIGDLDSPKPACVGNRKVKIELLPVNGKPVLFDVARSSEIGGGWMGSQLIANVVDSGPFSAARVKTPQVTRPTGKNGRVVCKAAKVVYPVTD